MQTTEEIFKIALTGGLIYGCYEAYKWFALWWFNVPVDPNSTPTETKSNPYDEYKADCLNRGGYMNDPPDGQYYCSLDGNPKGGSSVIGHGRPDPNTPVFGCGNPAGCDDNGYLVGLDLSANSNSLINSFKLGMNPHEDDRKNSSFF